MAIASGTLFGPYEVVSLAGSGGMGEVYRARDRRLGRHVAIKVLTAETVADRDRLSRFEREARLASSLNHPNIVTIYDIGEQNSIPYIAMELVEGKTLREIIAEGPSTVKQAVNIGVQIADALAKAHESGIVHRDLKPENVMVTADGVVKVLDFGLGKNAPSLEIGQSTILAVDPTNPGTILGTVDYMSPEQASGKETDFRSDQFSLGSMMYEMTAGRRAFRRETTVQTMSAIIADPAPAITTTSSGSVPGGFRKIVDRCLQKKPERRYTTTRELLTELRELSAILEVSTSSLSRVVTSVTMESLNRRPRMKWGMAAVLAILAALLVAAPFAVRNLFDNFGLSRPPLPEPKNLVILPFQVDSNDPDEKQFAAGLTEAVTSALTQLTTDSSLQLSPSSEVATRAVATPDDARSVLSANLVLTGRVGRNPDGLEVEWKLESTSERKTLRSGTVSVESSERLQLDRRTIEAVMGALELNVTPAARNAVLLPDTRIPAAKEAYLRARGYLQDYDKAENISRSIDLFKQALSLDSSYTKAHAGLGEAYTREFERNHGMQSVTLALESCRRAVEINDQNPAAHACLGRVYFGLGRYEEAVKEYQRALEGEPTSDDYRRQTALAEERLELYDSAESTLNKAIELRPKYWANYNVLGFFLMRRNRHAAAADAFDEVIKLAPDTAFGYANLGGAYIMQGKYTDALGVLQRAISIRPTASAYSNLGLVYFQKKQYLESAAAFEQATKTDGTNYALWGNLGDAYYWGPGTRERAPAAYRTALALGEEAMKVNPRDATLFSRLALYHAMLNDRSPALSFIARAVKAAPKDSNVLFKAALVYKQFNQDEEALAWLERAAAAGYSITTIMDARNFDTLWTHPKFQELVRRYKN